MASENAKAPRRRRAPEEAREELLNAADRLLFERGPEVVGLKDVAAEVGVTHSLVVHYFGSYAGLVRAVLVRRNQQAAAEALARFSEASATLDFEALGRHVFAFVSDRQRVRLSLWLSFQEDAPIEQSGGRMLRLLIDTVEAALPEIRRRQGKPPVSRDAIERAVLLIMAAGQGYALSGAQRWNALGHQPSPDLDGSFFRALWIGVEAILDALNLSPRPPPHLRGAAGGAGAGAGENARFREGPPPRSPPPLPRRRRGGRGGEGSLPPLPRRRG